MLKIRGQKGEEDMACRIDYIPFWSPRGKLRNESLAVLKWRLPQCSGMTMLQETHLIKFSSILLTESNSLDINSGLSANSCPSAPLKNNSIWWPGVCMHAKLLQSCPTLCISMDCSLPGSSVHGIHQARIPERVAKLSSRASSRPRDRTHVFCVAGGFFTAEPLGKPRPVVYWVSNTYKVWTLVREKRHVFFPKLFSLVEETTPHPKTRLRTCSMVGMQDISVEGLNLWQ